MVNIDFFDIIWLWLHRYSQIIHSYTWSTFHGHSWDCSILVGYVWLERFIFITGYCLSIGLFVNTVYLFEIQEQPELWTDDLVCPLSGVGSSTNQIYRENGLRREGHECEDRSFHYRWASSSSFCCYLYLPVLLLLVMFSLMVWLSTAINHQSPLSC